MKLIIDISDDVYTRLFDNGIQDNEIAVDDVCEMARALRMGIPLEEVKEEIENRAFNYIYIPQVFDILDRIGQGKRGQK